MATNFNVCYNEQGVWVFVRMCVRVCVHRCVNNMCVYFMCVAYGYVAV